jgi:hypothetical protein
MASRPTPFGLFAGCSVGTLGAVTRLTVEARSSYQRHTRLDGDYLAALSEALARDPAVRRAVTWRPNSSLYRSAGRIRYAESRLQGKVRSYHLVAVEQTDFLEATLARAGEGASLDTLRRRAGRRDGPGGRALPAAAGKADRGPAYHHSTTNRTHVHRELPNIAH